MNEDDIIRKRLTVEGDSGQDDRRLTGLLKTFLKWCAADSLSEEENEATFQKMLFTLGQVSILTTYMFVYKTSIITKESLIKPNLRLHLKPHPIND